jgi:serine/threonine protein kinase
LALHDHNTQPHPAEPPKPSKPGRFVYASGARPLAGYTIKRGVGQGGFGEIYYATSDAGKDVALKLIRRNLEIELRGIHQCLNLKHPNLLSLYDIRQDDKGDTWVVMEYVADASLDVVLSQRPKGFAADEALVWIHGIGAGVAYLHDRGIVHRDLKPGNIFLDEGVVKVGDYGLSKYISCSRRSGHTESVGTVHYMAPEVANGRYGKEIDVYAMGVILYELLTGRVPFEGESIGEVLMKHLTAVPDVSMIAQPYRAVIGKALEKDPERRYRSAAEMLAALPPCPDGAGLVRSPLPAPAVVSDRQPETPTPAHPSEQPIEAVVVKPVLPPWDADEVWDKGKDLWSQWKPTLKVFLILALLVWQYGMLALPWTVWSYTDARHPVYMYQKLDVPLWLGVLAPTAIVSLFFLAKWIVRRMDRNRPEKSWTGFKVAVVMALLLWQYGMLALPRSIWSYPNGPASRPIYMYEQLGPGLWFLVFAPTVIIMLLFTARRFVSWMEGERLQKKSWAESPTIVMPPSVAPAVGAGSVGVAVELPPQQAAAPAPAAPRALPRWYERPSPAMILKPPRERVAELFGSLLASALVAAIVSGVVTFVDDFCWGQGQVRPEEFGWLWLVGIVGSWSVLIPSKLWEGHRGDPVLRRIALLVIGTGVGLAAFGASEVLMVTLRYVTVFSHAPSYKLPSSFFDGFGQPLPMAYMACFGTLYFVVPWWRQADPMRRDRMSFWRLFVSALVALVVAQVWQFPQPWLPMAAVTISAAVQLASPWHHAGRRRR